MNVASAEAGPRQPATILFCELRAASPLPAHERLGRFAHKLLVSKRPNCSHP
jgi:hypothetical protein